MKEIPINNDIEDIQILDCQIKKIKKEKIFIEPKMSRSTKTFEQKISSAINTVKSKVFDDENPIDDINLLDELLHKSSKEKELDVANILSDLNNVNTADFFQSQQEQHVQYVDFIVNNINNAFLYDFNTGNFEIYNQTNPENWFDANNQLFDLNQDYLNSENQIKDEGDSNLSSSSPSEDNFEQIVELEGVIPSFGEKDPVQQEKKREKENPKDESEKVSKNRKRKSSFEPIEFKKSEIFSENNPVWVYYNLLDNCQTHDTDNTDANRPLTVVLVPCQSFEHTRCIGSEYPFCGFKDNQHQAQYANLKNGDILFFAAKLFRGSSSSTFVWAAQIDKKIDESIDNGAFANQLRKEFFSGLKPKNYSARGKGYDVENKPEDFVHLFRLKNVFDLRSFNFPYLKNEIIQLAGFKSSCRMQHALTVKENKDKFIQIFNQLIQERMATQSLNSTLKKMKL